MTIDATTTPEASSRARAKRKGRSGAPKPHLDQEHGTSQANGSTEGANGTAKPSTPERKLPVTYTDEVADIILRRLREGESLLSICQSEDLPSESAVRQWAADPAHPFAASYAHAREVGYLKMADEVIALSDGLQAGSNRFEPGVVQRHRLMVDSRKWILSKALPKIFGDKLDVTSAGKALAVASDLDIAKALAHALAAPALPAPTVLDAEAVPVKNEGEP